MNKVISIHLCGVAFQLEENGYDALRTYLEKAERQLSTNPDKAEILADIERAIADKFRALLAAGRNVVLSAEVDSVIKEMGPVTNDIPGEDTASKSGSKNNPNTFSDQGSTTPPPVQPKRLYRLKDGAMLAGVCNGLAAYIGVDVTLLRLVVAVLVFFSFGTVAIAYIVSILIIPQAQTAEEKTAATGANPTTAQEFIRRAKEGYYEGYKTFGDREAHRAWKRKFKNEMRDWKQRLRHEYRWGWWAHPASPVPPAPPPPPTSPMASVPPPEGIHVVMPILATLKALLLFFCMLGILSLFTTDSLLGLPLPGHMPTWAGIVLVILAYKVAVAPIKAIRRNYYYRLNGWPVHFSPFTEFWLSLLPFVVIAFCIWLADLSVPAFHQALLNIPTFLQNAAESVHQWWGHR